VVVCPGSVLVVDVCPGSVLVVDVFPGMSAQSAALAGSNRHNPTAASITCFESSFFKHFIVSSSSGVSSPFFESETRLPQRHHASLLSTY